VRALRIIDIALALIGLVSLAPVFVLLYLAVWSETKDPFFIQERLGKNKEPFLLYKFRTMRVDTADLPTHLVASSAVTPLGRFLRRTKLDELPQLWNVLLGDMSFVGPRPGLPNHVELTAARTAAGVFSARPGITGRAQIRGIDMSTPELLARTDADMLRTLDVKNYITYIFLTAIGHGGGDRIK